MIGRIVPNDHYGYHHFRTAQIFYIKQRSACGEWKGDKKEGDQGERIFPVV